KIPLRALMFVCGLGYHELHINGRKIGDHMLSPGWTKYDKTCLYEAFVITSELRAGSNAVGIVLGNGMYHVRGGRYSKFTGNFGPLKAIAKLHLWFADGTKTVVSTDGDWRVLPGPITFSCVYGGEDHDSRQ